MHKESIRKAMNILDYSRTILERGPNMSQVSWSWLTTFCCSLLSKTNTKVAVWFLFCLESLQSSPLQPHCVLSNLLWPFAVTLFRKRSKLNSCTWAWTSFWVAERLKVVRRSILIVEWHITANYSSKRSHTKKYYILLYSIIYIIYIYIYTIIYYKKWAHLHQKQTRL